jgi:nucleoside-diphosphate-sugar epimerase
VAAYGEIYGREIPIRWVDYQEFVRVILPAAGAHYHFTANMCPSLEKIRQKLGYEPRYTPEQTLARAVDWLRARGLV